MGVGILEKNKVPGGALQSFKRKGIVFDTGIHYIGGLDTGQNLNQYFRYFGLIDKINIRRLNQNRFDMIALGDKEYPLAQGFDNFIDQLLPYFPDCKKTLEKYISTIKEIASSFPLYNFEFPGNPSEETFRNKSAFDFYHSLQTTNADIKHSGSWNETCSIFSSVLAGNSFLYAGNKDKTPLYIPALINHSFISSAWRPVDGSSQIADLLIQSIIEAGGTIIKNTKVNGIRYTNDTFYISTDPGESFFSKYLL